MLLISVWFHLPSVPVSIILPRFEQETSYFPTIFLPEGLTYDPPHSNKKTNRSCWTLSLHISPPEAEAGGKWPESTICLGLFNWRAPRASQLPGPWGPVSQPLESHI